MDIKEALKRIEGLSMEFPEVIKSDYLAWRGLVGVLYSNGLEIVDRHIPDPREGEDKESEEGEEDAYLQTHDDLGGH